MFWFILICQHLCIFNDPENFSRKFSNVSYHNYQSCLWLICCLEEPFATLRLSFSMCLFSLSLECSPVQLHYVKQIKSHSLQHRLSFQHYLDKRHLLGTYQNIFLFFWKQMFKTLWKESRESLGKNSIADSLPTGLRKYKPHRETAILVKKQHILNPVF